MPGVAPGNVGDRIVGKGKYITEFLTPSLFVHGGRIDLTLAPVRHDPAREPMTVNFDPNVIGEIENVASVKTSGPAKESKQIRVFTASTPTRLQEFARGVVSRKSCFFGFADWAPVNCLQRKNQTLYCLLEKSSRNIKINSLDLIQC